MKKKVCIVSYCNLYLLPYVKFYLETIKKSGYECDLLYWDRDVNNDEKYKYDGCKKVLYQKRISSNTRAFKKIIGYIAATAFFKKVLKRNNYDRVVFLQTHAAVLCKSILLKKYKNRFVVDIRDYTLENYKLYRVNEEKVLKASQFNVISSIGYKNFLPKCNYVVAHNYDAFDSNQIEEVLSNHTLKNEVIRISFVGTIRFLEMDKKILQLFKNDSRFQINYYGNGSDTLREYCQKNLIKNVDFEGSFNNKDTYKFYLKTDIINNLYGNKSPFLDYALSNKLYHAAQFNLPILVCKNTYMEQISKKYNLGHTFDFEDPKALDELYEWYSNYDRNKLEMGAKAFLEEVIKENNCFKDKINSFFEINED